ncbi:MAG: NPCBM/NEW2 domain-containing protein [Planctomycetota bacterium]
MPQPPKAFYVATDGSDDAPGTPGKPFATLERARDAIRALKQDGGLPEGGVTVFLRGGTYSRAKTFELTEADGGTEAAPIVYRGQPGEAVRLTGAREVEGFEPVSDRAVLERLDEAAQGKVLQADLRAQGITAFGELTRGALRGGPMLELFFDGEAMPLSRWPNQGFAKYGKVLDRGSVPRFGEKPDRPGKMLLGGDRYKRWTQAPAVWLHGYFHHDWYDDVLKVAELDAETGEVVFTTPHLYGLVSGRRYAAINLLEEIDRPGEWTLDRRSGILYFWPPEPVEQATVAVSMLDEPLVRMTKTTHVTVRDVTLELSRGKAVEILGGTDNLLAGCTIRNMGTSAVRIGPAEVRRDGHLRVETGDPLIDGRRNGVQSCDIHDVGTSGISLVGGDRRSLAPGRHFAVNNDIHHYSRRKRTNCPAISLAGVGHRMAHNRIHDAPHCGVFYSGNDHVLELNEAYRLSWETGDVGTFYSGRNWTYRGNVVRHNFFHHIQAPGRHGSMTVYLDDSHSSTAIVGNVFYRTDRAAFIGGGRDNRVEGNLFIECNAAVHLDNRSQGWARKYQKPGGDHRMYAKLKEVRHDQPPWSDRYPKLARILKDDPHAPKGNVVRNNVAVRCRRWLDVYRGGKKLLTLEDNFVTKEDPGFVNPEAMDFRLKPDSIVFDKVPGFEPIPFERIGLRVDEYRPALPVGEPVVTPPGGGFVGSLRVRLSPSRADLDREDIILRYTLDGSEPTAKAPRYQQPIELEQSATLRARAFARGEGGTVASPIVGATFRVIDFGPGKPVHLSDLIPSDSLAHGGLKRDANYAESGPIRLGGNAYRKGLLMHPESGDAGGTAHAVWPLTHGLAEARRLKATVGIDDAVGRRGSAVFFVDVQRGGKWEQVFKSGVLRGGGKPVAIDVAIAGAQALRLRTTDAGDDINADHAVWADARLE